MDGLLMNNRAILCGLLETPLEKSHQLYGEVFYSCMFRIPRLSDYYDILPVTLSERLLVGIDMQPGTQYTVTGQLRSYNKYIDGGNRLILTVFARQIVEGRSAQLSNDICLEGYICKPPIFRTTPFKREITDILLAVNRSYNKSDYIPCIAWSRNARFAGAMNVGDKVNISGRMQSREYEKQLPNGDVAKRTAFEVSISRIETFEVENSEFLD